jgi:hypothetical protein
MLGTEKIEQISECLKDVAILAKKISEDKKVDINDLPHLIAFLPKLGEIVEAFKGAGEAIEEAKDIDVAEVVALIQMIHKKVKEVEQA